MAKEPGGKRRGGSAALAAASNHLDSKAGDKAAPAGEEIAENQGGGVKEAGDKDGEIGRREFTLNEDQRAELSAARDRDVEDGKTAGEPDYSEHERKFWSDTAPGLGANQVTVEAAEDVLESGRFTAWPAEEAPAFDPSTNEEDHNASLDRFEQIVQSGSLDLPTLGGDTRDIMLDIFRNRHKPWTAMSPSEQRDVASGISLAVQATVARVVQLVASGGRPAIKATLERYADKGGEITATVKIAIADDATVLGLHRASGKTVMIVLADTDAFMGQRREAVEREDPELAFEAGDDNARPAAPAGDRDLSSGPKPELEPEQLYAEAVRLVREHQNASPSWLQRKLEIGFTVADALIERMEAEGIVSAPDVTTKRTIFPWESGESGGKSGASAPEPAETA